MLNFNDELKKSIEEALTQEFSNSPSVKHYKDVSNNLKITDEKIKELETEIKNLEEEIKIAKKNKETATAKHCVAMLIDKIILKFAEEKNKMEKELEKRKTEFKNQKSSLATIMSDTKVSDYMRYTELKVLIEKKELW